MIASPDPQTLRNVLASLYGGELIEERAGELVADPADEQQASELLQACDRLGLAVNIESGGTKQGWLDAAKPGVRLQTRRMHRVLEHTWQDMTCTVQAGCTWQVLQNRLSLHGQSVALDPLWADRATVGGVIAANDSGALRLRYGALRDLVIGMTVVLADGTIARSGGKVVKNVAGYDLPKLLCGSFGTLALITEVTFRLHSIAPHTATLSAVSATAGPLGKLLLRLLDLHFSLQSMQLRGDASGFSLDVRLAAMSEVLASQSDNLNGVAGSLGLTAEPASPELWSAREELFSDGSKQILFKASMLPTEIALQAQQVVDHGGAVVVQATGLMTGRVPCTAESSLLSLRASIEAANGSLVLLQRPLGVELDRWGVLPEGLPLMRAVKRQFDPRWILNPGRFLGIKA